MMQFFGTLGPRPNEIVHDITGVGVRDGKVYVADATKERIVILNATTLAETGAFPAPRPGALALGKDDNLWVVLRPGVGTNGPIFEVRPSAGPADNTPPAQVLCYDANNKPMPERARPSGIKSTTTTQIFMKLNLTMRNRLASDRVTTLLKSARWAGGNSPCWLAILLFAGQPTMVAQDDEARPAGVSAVWGVSAKRFGLKETFFFVDNLSSVPGRSQTDSLRVRQVAGSAPANLSWPGEEVTVTVQLVNLTDQPIRAAGKVDVIPYGLTTSPDDMFNVAMRKLGQAGSVPISVDIPVKGFQDVTLHPPIPERFGAYALILELPGHER